MKSWEWGLGGIGMGFCGYENETEVVRNDI